MGTLIKFICWVGGSATTAFAYILAGPIDASACLQQRLSEGTPYEALHQYAINPCHNIFGSASTPALQTSVAGVIAVVSFFTPFLIDKIMEGRQN